MPRWRRGPALNTAIDPQNIRVGEVFSIDGVRFKCIGKPRNSHDTDYLHVPTRKWGVKGMTPVKRSATVLVAR